MNHAARIAHALIRTAASSDARFFARHRRNASLIQERVLMAILRRNRDTVFGRRHQFDRISSVAAFREQVPVGTWEEFAPMVDEMRGCGTPVLTSAAPRLYQPTSGSSQSVKLIPTTAELKGEFSRAVNVWLSDLYRRFPRIADGPHYWSVSPPAAQHLGATDASVGFNDDAEYLGWRGALVRAAMAVPTVVRRAASVDAFLVSTMAHLLIAEDLSLISVWSPSFLTILIDILERRTDEVMRVVAEQRSSARRVKAISDILLRHGAASPSAMAALWPRLALVSCWADGASAEPAQRVRQLFAHAVTQPKGLCATEGIVSIPLDGSEGAVAAYTSHFLEFLPEGGGPARGVAELDIGGTYSVVMTTGGGLYRYALGDLVLVTGHRDGLPVLTFLCRDRVCDMAGEKLNEHAVAQALDGAMGDAGMAAEFGMLAPEKSGDLFRYVLFVKLRDRDARVDAGALAAELDRRLRRNFHYDYARNLGQLSSCEVVVLGAGAPRAYLDRCVNQGMKAGDVKPVVLDRRTDWRAWFTASSTVDRSATCA
jgi:hypothetical protein